MIAAATDSFAMGMAVIGAILIGVRNARGRPRLHWQFWCLSPEPL